MTHPAPADLVADAHTAAEEPLQQGPVARLERRAHPRQALSVPGRWHGDGRWLLVSVESLSPGGATLCTQVPLRAESQGLLTLDELDEPIAATVRWARGASAGVCFALSEPQAARLDALIRRYTDKGLLDMAGPAQGPGSDAGES
jgi:hypothetical protein